MKYTLMVVSRCAASTGACPDLTAVWFLIGRPVHCPKKRCNTTAARIADRQHSTSVISQQSFTEEKQVRIRLVDIDALEHRQPYGTRAREMLSALCFGKTVTATYDGADRYGRSSARIRADGTDINAEMVRRGAAWVYRNYSKAKSFLAIEDEAKSRPARPLVIARREHCIAMRMANSTRQ